MKEIWKPGNMVYPLPAVLVSCAAGGRDNLITVAWTGTLCSEPAMTYVSVRPERYSYNLIRESGEFVINLTTQALCAATDFCGVRSGREVDKFEACGLHREKAQFVAAPLLAESPVNIECRVKEVREYGSHHMFAAEVLAVHVDTDYMNEKGKFDLEKAGVIAYSHGEYFGLGEKLGRFGYSVKKK